jgi:hypothetical protein
MTDELQHHGVKGQKWGVRRPDGPDGTVTGIAGKGTPTKGGDKKGTAKPNPSAFKKSPQRVAAEHREQIMREIETLRSAGREDLAKKLEATLNGIPKGAEEGEDTEAQTEGEGEDKEGKEEEEDKKKKGKAGKAAAAPKAAKPKEDKAALAAEKAAKEKAAKEKAERSKWQALAKSQREVADSFREGVTSAKQEIAKLTNSANSIRNRLPGFRKDLETATKNGDKGAMKTLSEMISRLEGEAKGLDAAIGVQTSQAEKLSAKAKEWDELSDKSLANIKDADDDKKREAIRHGEALVHYGVKGMKWGVRKDRGDGKFGVAKKEMKPTALGGLKKKVNAHFDKVKKDAYDRMLKEADEFDGHASDIDAAIGKAKKSKRDADFNDLEGVLRQKKDSILKLADSLDEHATSNLRDRDENEVLSYNAESLRHIAKGGEGFPATKYDKAEFVSQMFKDGAKYNRQDAATPFFDDVRHGDPVERGEKYIQHYGIKGMRWGVRRTAAQLGRAGKKSSRQAQRDASKEAKTLSDSELKARINRLQMEKQYSDLVKQQVERDRTAMEEGAAAVGNILLQSGKESLKNTTSASMTYAMKKGVSKTGIPLKNKKK